MTLDPEEERIHARLDQIGAGLTDVIRILQERAAKKENDPHRPTEEEVQRAARSAMAITDGLRKEGVKGE